MRMVCALTAFEWREPIVLMGSRPYCDAASRTPNTAVISGPHRCRCHRVEGEPILVRVKYVSYLRPRCAARRRLPEVNFSVKNCLGMCGMDRKNEVVPGL